MDLNASPLPEGDEVIYEERLDKHSARQELRVTATETMHQGAPVKVRRPSDYNPSLNLGAVGLTPGSAGGLEGPDRIFVGGLPYYFTEAQIRELLESFGPLRGFDLVKERYWKLERLCVLCLLGSLGYRYCLCGS